MPCCGRGWLWWSPYKSQLRSQECGIDVRLHRAEWQVADHRGGRAVLRRNVFGSRVAWTACTDEASIGLALSTSEAGPTYPTQSAVNAPMDLRPSMAAVSANSKFASEGYSR